MAGRKIPRGVSHVAYAAVHSDDKMVLTTEPTVAVLGLVLGGAKQEKQPTEQKLTFRSSLPQVTASIAVQTFNLMVGVSMAYSSALIPQLEAEDSDIYVTRQESAWLASVLVLTVPVGAAVAGVMQEQLGRLNIIKLACIPYLAAWIIIATANSFGQILAGRLLMGMTLGIGSNAGILYIAEVAHKTLRGGLSCLGPTLASLGIVIGYIAGALMDWRSAAWGGCVVPIIPLGLMFGCAMESPVWLRSRGRLLAAQKSSMYFYNDPDWVMSAPSAPASPTPPRGKAASPAAASGASQRPPAPSVLAQFGMLLGRASGIKPLIIITLIFLIQQMCGIYITIYFAVTFFQEARSEMDAYLASILIGVVRFFMCLLTSFLMGKVNRRSLMMCSAIGMAITMGISAYATWQIQLDDNFPSWVVVTGILLYVATGCLGFQTIPWTMIAEIFPHEVRGVAGALIMGLAHIFMFAFLQVYPALNVALGGSVGVQVMFSVVSLASAIFIWIFMPETCGKTLAEIEDYFQHNIIFLGQKKVKKSDPDVVPDGAV